MVNKNVFDRNSLYGVRQGDSYPIKFRIVTKNGDILALENVQDVSIAIGEMSKQYSDNELQYDELNKLWLFPLSQQETFLLKETPHPALIRVKLENGDVVSTEVPPIDVLHSIDKEVL